MTFLQRWRRGAVICLTVALALFPAAFYGGILMVVVASTFGIAHHPISELSTMLLWGAFSLIYVPYFVSMHSAKIADAASS